MKHNYTALLTLILLLIATACGLEEDPASSATDVGDAGDATDSNQPGICDAVYIACCDKGEVEAAACGADGRHYCARGTWLGESTDEACMEVYCGERPDMVCCNGDAEEALICSDQKWACAQGEPVESGQCGEVTSACTGEAGFVCCDLDALSQPTCDEETGTWKCGPNEMASDTGEDPWCYLP